MDRITRWETEAIRGRSRRPRPRSGVIDLRDSRREQPPTGIESDDPPPGTLLVPLDAWQRMLDQLGNLHEAGQQLAEASARAAKAETEAEFLRERVADLRRQLEEATSETPRPDGNPDPATSLVKTAAAQVRSLFRTLRPRTPHPGPHN